MPRLLPILAAAALTLSCKPADAATDLRGLTDEARASWKTLGDIELSADGRWLAYTEVPSSGNGDVTVVVRKTRSDLVRRFTIPAADATAVKVKMAPSGRWVAFLRNDGATGAPILQLLEPESGKVSRFPGITDFEFSPASGEHLALRSSPEAGTAESSVSLIRLLDARQELFEHVTEYAFDSKGEQFAWATPHGVQVRTLGTARTVSIAKSETQTRYGSLTWSPSGRALAMLRAESVGSTDQALLVFTRNGEAFQEHVFESSTWVGFPAGWKICARPVLRKYIWGTSYPLAWRDDEAGLYFASCVPSTPPPDSGQPPNLALWHWKDDRLPGIKKLLRDWEPGFVSFVWLEGGRFVKLASPELPNVSVQKRGRHVLGFDANRYGWKNETPDSRGVELRDYSIIDLEDGARTALAEALAVPPSSNGTVDTLVIQPLLSPDGAFVLYQRDGDYMSYEVATTTVRNLTGNLPTKFYYEQNPPQGRHQLKRSENFFPVLQGWTDDGASVLISDYYDIWQVPLKGGRAVNLTGNGRRDRINYGRALYAPGSSRANVPADWSVAPDDALYFQGIELDTRRARLTRLKAGGKMELLRRDDAQMEYFKSSVEAVNLYTRMSATKSTDLYSADESWRTGRRLSDINPQQREMRWFPPPRFLTYRSPNGDKLHAALYLPFGAGSSQRHPTIVNIYEDQLSGAFHNYLDPGAPLSYITVIYWLQRGYAVLWPDVIPRVGEPGQAALEAVQAAVKAAVATGSVDGDRLGLFGHSYGAYETNFIVARSPLFRAAVSYAGMSNLWSHCGALNGSRPVSLLCENGQGSLGAPWWQRFEAYLQGSPLYHAADIRTPLLLVHGDRDTAVSFSQSVELFNALRRMGDKQVVLLEYKGEGHELRKESVADMLSRMTQFFGHYLKDEPAPRWWADGISYYEAEAQ